MNSLIKIALFSLSKYLILKALAFFTESGNFESISWSSFEEVAQRSVDWGSELVCDKDYSSSIGHT